MDLKHFDNFDTAAYKAFSNPALIQKDLRVLSGMLEGVYCDATVNQREFQALQNWVESYRSYEDKQPYRSVIRHLRKALADGHLTMEECEDVKWYCDQYIDNARYFSGITQGIQHLSGIVKGMVSDQVINDREIHYLDEWMEVNEHLKSGWPYDELYNMVTQILSDGKITDEEKSELIHFCNAFVLSESSSGNLVMIDELNKGFYQIDPDIILPEKTFCITGLSKKYTRRELAAQIELHGGYVTDAITKKLDYLIVCDEKNECWAFSCYGRKIEKAMKYRREGVPLVIVHEFDLYDKLEGMK